jgi:hypothetical protein
MRRAVSTGAEEDDLVGLEALGDLPGEAANDSARYLGAAIPAARPGVRIVTARFGVRPGILHENRQIARRGLAAQPRVHGAGAHERRMTGRIIRTVSAELDPAALLTLHRKRILAVLKKGLATAEHADFVAKLGRG